MLKAREILRLKHEVGLSLREIGNACSCGKSTVSEVLERATKAGITWPVAMNDKQLLSLLYPPVIPESKASVPEPDPEYIFREMKKKGVTLMLLWEEYKSVHPDGVMYTQFCERYRKFKQENQLVMHKEHKAGEEVEVDWAGLSLSYTHTITGEEVKAYIFVAVLPASHYPFVYAYDNMQLPNWIDAHVRMFEYFHGVPRITIPDNTRTAVIGTDLFDPTLNRSYHEMAQHYRTTVLPARSRKPRDKGSDENMVNNVTRRILAPLRDRRFFSLHEINKAIAEELQKFIHRPFKKREGNRLSAFLSIDKPALQQLPTTRYEYAEWTEAKVQFNYHVEHDKKYFYSVHYSYVGQFCSVRATAKTIEVFIGNERIAAHKRNYNPYKRYTTLPEHMPENHKAVSGWSSERFIEWAEKVGPWTDRFIRELLESREYPVQTYRACMGIMRLAKSYSHELMENASQEALAKELYSFKYFSMILKQQLAKKAEGKQDKPIAHENIRGSSAFKGGGLRA
jgi:transposase